MSLHALNDIRSLDDPLKQFQVKFTISMVPALILATTQQKLTGVLDGNFSTVTAKELELRCTSFTYPGTKLGQTSLTIGGFRRKLGTIQNKSGIWDCKITEDQNGGVLNTIQSWCDLIHNPFNGVRLPAISYVTTCVVDIQSAQPRKSPWKQIYGNRGRRIYLKGFYPIEYTVGQIDASGSQPVEIDVKFNYDWWSEVVTPSISSVSASLGI
jgi:hypothetical protein